MIYSLTWHCETSGGTHLAAQADIKRLIVDDPCWRYNVWSTWEPVREPSSDFVIWAVDSKSDIEVSKHSRI